MRGSIVVAVIGTDGAGKTSCVEALKDRLERRHIECAVFHPRPYFAYWANEQLDSQRVSVTESELLRYLSLDVTRQLIWDILPLAATNDVVFVDRYIDCSLAKGIAAGVDAGTLEFVRALRASVSRPAVTYWLDVSSRVAAERMSTRGSSRDADVKIVRKRNAYQTLYEEDPERYVRVDADKSFGDVTGFVEEHLSRLLDSLMVKTTYANRHGLR